MKNDRIWLIATKFWPAKDLPKMQLKYAVEEFFFTKLGTRHQFENDDFIQGVRFLGFHGAWAEWRKVLVWYSGG